eukprot:IDg16226t1
MQALYVASCHITLPLLAQYATGCARNRVRNPPNARPPCGINLLTAVIYSVLKVPSCAASTTQLLIGTSAPRLPIRAVPPCAAHTPIGRGQRANAPRVSARADRGGADMATKSELRRRRAAEVARKPGSDGEAGTPNERRREKRHLTPPSPGSSADSDPNSKLRRRASGGLSVGITPLDVGVCFALLAAAAAVRFHRLAGVQSVVFDEVHYLKFIRWTIKGEYFFDVNPVFGKLALAALARLLRFDEQLQDFNAPGEPLPSAMVAFAARAPAAIFGALTVPVFYRVCRLLRLSTWAAIVGACFILLDSMHVIQSRIAMVDSVLVFLTCASLLFALMLWNSKNVATLKRSSVAFPDVARIVIGLVLTGGASGLAVSTRWTAFATPVLISVISVFGVAPFCYEPLNLLECAIL